MAREYKKQQRKNETRLVHAGLKTFASLQSTRQLSEHTAAGLGLTWQPKVGVGLQLSSTRQLSDTTSADFSLVVGPRAAQGAGLSISRRGERLTTSARLDVSPEIYQSV